MYAPVLVTPAAAPVSLANAKLHLNVDHSDDDTIIQSFIDAAAVHVSRTIGYALGAQTWRQDFDDFDQVMRLPVGPASSVTSVTYRDEAGDSTTVSTADYELLADDFGSYVRFKDDYSLPSDLYETAAVRITWVAGSVPEPLVAAVKLIVGDLYQNREAKVVSTLVENPAAKALMSTYRVF